MGYVYRSKFLRWVDSSAYTYPKQIRKKIVFFISIVSILLIVHVWFNMQSVKINYQINKLKKKKFQLEAKNKILQVKLQYMLSKKEIEKIAKTRYGFKTPEIGQIVVIKDEEKSLLKIFKRILNKKMKI